MSMTNIDLIKKIMAEEKLIFGQLTFGDLVFLAEKTKNTVGQLVIFEASEAESITPTEVKEKVKQAYAHNMLALDMGLKDTGKSFLFGQVASELSKPNVPAIAGTPLLDKAIKYTLATQVGNHCVGLRPCAGTGDSCPYTGLAKAAQEEIADEDLVLRAMAIMLKLGTFFRVAKTTTGCNMEGFGAGSAAAAAAFSEIWASSPQQTSNAVVLAISPTLGVPCTPRVMVPGLCATHIGGAIMNGWLAAFMSRYSNMPVNVPVDLMLAMAAAIHPVSAKEVVPVVIKYMEPFFKVNQEVENYIDVNIKEDDIKRRQIISLEAVKETKEIAAKAGSITNPFGDIVVGGSSQAVGSPANTARLAHYLAEGKISKIIIELYPELFARRAINVPAMVMAGVYGNSTEDGKAYSEAMEKAKNDNIEIEIKEIDEYQVQKVTLIASGKNAMVKAYNRGGARLVLLEAVSGDTNNIEKAKSIAKDLGIQLVK